MAPPCGSAASHHHEVRIGQRKPGGELSEFHEAASAGPVGVERERASRAVVDDAVFGVGRRRTDVEGIGND